jgi:hypothetical protein
LSEIVTRRLKVYFRATMKNGSMARKHEVCPRSKPREVTTTESSCLSGLNPPGRTRSSGESRSNLYYGAEGWVRRSPAGFCLAAALFTTKTASAPWGGPARTRRDFAIVGRTEFDPVRQRSERPLSCRRTLVADEFSSMICVGSQPSCSRWLQGRTNSPQQGCESSHANCDFRRIRKRI